LNPCPIYLDHHATTPTDPRVVEAMLPYFTTKFGNPSSLHHAYGWEAADAVDDARERLSALIGATSASEIIFTSGATESNNLAIKGVASALRSKGDHIVSSSIEHRAVLDPLRVLARSHGFTLTLVPPDPDGQTRPEVLAAALTDRTILVSLMWANNELGTINRVEQVARMCRGRGILFHTDASQAVGKLPIDLKMTEIDLLSLSGHKLYGPKGIGALYVRRRVPRPVPLLDGGGQERGLRSGTLPVPLIVGLGEAAAIAGREGEAEAQRVHGLRDRLHQGLFSALSPPPRLNGHPTQRLPGSLNLAFEGISGEALMMNLRGLAVSSGSACTSADPEPSHVLRAVGLPEGLARASLRFGLGRFTTAEEVDQAIVIVSGAVNRLRS
jgi:cysteine desulfurase